MSKKTILILSGVLFVILIALILCEKRWPAGGAEFLEALFLRG